MELLKETMDLAESHCDTSGDARRNCFANYFGERQVHQVAAATDLSPRSINPTGMIQPCMRDDGYMIHGYTVI